MSFCVRVCVCVKFVCFGLRLIGFDFVACLNKFVLHCAILIFCCVFVCVFFLYFLKDADTEELEKMLVPSKDVRYETQVQEFNERIKKYENKFNHLKNKNDMFNDNKSDNNENNQSVKINKNIFKIKSNFNDLKEYLKNAVILEKCCVNTVQQQQQQQQGNTNEETDTYNCPKCDSILIPSKIC